MTNDLEGRVALVTGAAQGVGLATARQLAERGATLVVTDVNDERLLAAAADLATITGSGRGRGREPTVIVADLATATGPAEILDGAFTAHDRVDLLASVAGRATRATILDTDLATWDEMVNLNLRSHFQLIQGVARRLVALDAPGSIACAGSVNANGGQADLCAYSAAKGGLVTLARHAAHALLPHRIRVNVVNYGWMHTPGEIEIQAALGNSEAWLADAGSRLPFGRLIQPEEAAKLLVYLLSDDSSVMTGATIAFDQAVPGAGVTSETRTDRLHP